MANDVAETCFANIVIILFLSQRCYPSTKIYKVCVIQTNKLKLCTLVYLQKYISKTYKIIMVTK